MRDIFKVLEEIKQLSDDENFMKKIEKLEYSLSWKAPEDTWNYMYDVFITDFIPPKSELDYKVLSIWTTKSIEELKNIEEVEKVGGEDE